MLRNRRVADHHEVPRARRKAVDGAALVHPLEERQEQSPAEQVGHVVELGAGDGDPGAVAGADGQRPGQGGEPVGADPRAGLGVAGLRALDGGVLLGGASDRARAKGREIAGRGDEGRERRRRGAEGERGEHCVDAVRRPLTAAVRRLFGGVVLRRG